MQKYNLTFFKKILLFALTLILVLISIILSSSVAFKKIVVQNQITNHKTILLESQILRKEFEISKDTIKINSIINNIDYISNSYKNSNKSFKNDLFKYKNQINELKHNYIKKGLNENLGIEGQFRTIIHNIENVLLSKNNKDLLILILQLRRHEKDFMLRKNPKYINLVEIKVKQIEKLITKNKVKFYQLNTSEININHYHSYFLKLTETINNIDSLDLRLKTLEKSINAQIKKEVELKNIEANRYLELQNKIFYGSILLIIIVSYILAKSISKPLNALKIATNKISKGDYKYRAEIISNDEIGKFTSLFNTMVDKLQAAYKKIEFDKQELENVVNERTNYLINTIEELKVITAELENTKYELLNKNFEMVNNLEREQELNKLKTKFVQTVSHEYRTPLTVILNSTYLIEQFSRMGNMQKLILHNNRIKESVKVMKVFLEDLFTIEKLDYGKIDIKYTDFNLSSYLKSFVNEINLANTNNIDLIDNTSNSQINTDIGILTQILNNIISNSIKYKSHKNNTQVPEISIVITEETMIFKLEIIDNGIGILESELKLIFEAFFRGSNVSNIPGMGIGLTITKKYLELINSNIFIESEINVGTKVILELPKNQI